MSNNNNIITLRLSKEAIESYRFLQQKKINPAKYLRNGGEKELIAREFKFKLKLRKKEKLPF